MAPPGAPRTANAAAMDPRLAPFASSRWTVEGFSDTQLSTLSEKGIRTLASELATLRQTTSQEMQRSVFANYGAFIRTAKEIADLQSDLSRSRALLSGMGSVLATLREPPADDFFDAALLSVATPSKRSVFTFDLSTPAPASTAATEALTELTEQLEVHIAEGRLDVALKTLERATRHLAAAQREQEEAGMLGDESAGLGATVARQRGELAAALAAAVAEPSTPTSRRRSAVQGLVRLGEGGRAYDLLLRHHSATLAAALRWLRAPRRDDVQGMRVYTAEVSHAVCDALANAVQDAGAAFATEPARASALLAWAKAGIAQWADVLMSEEATFGAAASLHDLAVGVRIVFAHAALLEPFGLCAGPLLAQLLRPRVAAALEAELANGTPAPELITAAEAYLRGGTCVLLQDAADVVLRAVSAPPPPALMARVLALGSTNHAPAAAPPPQNGHRRTGSFAR